MAKAKYAIGVDTTLTQDFSNGLSLISNTETEATWSSLQTYGTFTVKGDNLKYDNNHNFIGGTIEKITFRDAEGLLMATVTGEYSAVKFEKDFGTTFFDDFLFAKGDKVIGSNSDDNLFAMNGKDLVQGRGGDDWLDGGNGNDRLTGGEGSDSFAFKFTMASADDPGKPQHDVVTDFDARGGGDKQDHLASFEPVSIKQVGDDSVLKYEDGSTLTLLDVKRSDISEADFFLI